MHELSIAQNILETLEAERERHRFLIVKKVNITIGPLSNVVADSLRFCFDAVKEQTVAAGASLNIIETTITGRCRVCGMEFTVEQFAFICPNCGATGIDVLTGNEMQITSIDVE